MELTNFSFYYSNSVDEEAVGAIAYRNLDNTFHGSLIHDFDISVVVVYVGEFDEPAVQHTILRGEHCQVLSVGIDELQQSLLSGEDNVLLKCFLEGDIISDTDGQLAVLRRDFLRFAGSKREQQLFIGFARFLQKYVDAKVHIKDGRVLDAYQSILGGLYHWAEIELIERGIHPESAVWEQMSGLNTPVRKLYEELTVSTETLGQRIELVMLACEFCIISKMADCSAILLRILRNRRTPWTVQELMQHPELEPVSSELPLILRKLVYYSLVKEVSAWKETIMYGYEHIRYFAE
ncbi:Nucleotidyltransferase-like [Paenibacillus uliginis N3/975]|uniref:Nucleotidyltransferase-like n=1 Tax=Paenibacillus uliginis N3/975 TaxID=1313296 RepID=A0A1X7GKU0_9BACL|nr:nucleotidyltransferase-like protein [Paenibacillus uliginis]SMF71321.1 Nucleotidyltransferase-like [Paenibacillus uliginis N3/975]